MRKIYTTPPQSKDRLQAKETHVVNT
uniref:Uncharacterized protein n=1 Tax=Arundo donax TaxID=35708 RepID=A0A0A9H9Z3_ARUDO